MNKIITFLLLILIQPTFSQSVDLDPHSFNLSYVTLPQKPVLERKNRTYVLNVVTGNVYDFRTAKDYLDYNFSIDGFKNVASNAYFEIGVDLRDPVAVIEAIKKIENKVKESNGVERIETSYKVIVTVKESGNFTINCPLDASFNKKYSLENSFTLENSFATFDGAKKFGAEVLSGVRGNYLLHVTSSMDARLNHDFGFVIEQTSDYLWILDSKKHPEFDSNVMALSNVKTVFNKMRYDEDVASLKTELEPTIKYFEGVDKKYVEDERKQRKLRYGAYYNLATIYHYLDMPEESDLWCDRLINNKYDATDGKSMKLRNESLRESFAVNQVKSRHMDVEARTNGIGQEDKVDVANFDPSYFLKNDSKYGLISLVLTTNDTVSGYAKLSSIANLDRKIAISIPDENGNHNHLFKTYFADEVSKLIIQEYDFYSTVSFKDATKTVSGKPVFRFVREVLNGKTVSLYQYYTGEIVVKKHKDSIGYSTNSVGWQMNTRTKFIELADSCPRLAARANGKEFQNDLNSLRKFVEALDMCK